jgi:BolA protein
MQNLIEQLTQRLEESLHPTFLNIEDDSAMHAGHAGNKGGAHLTLHVVSNQFEGKLPVARHRMIYEALASWMTHDIHALSIQAQTPLEYISTRSKT